MLNKKISIILTILISIEIFYMSSLPGGSVTGGISFIPIIYHFTVFFLLAFFSNYSTNKKTENIQITLIILILLAILDEVHQIFAPGRCAGIFDVLVDSVGILCGTLIYLLTK